MISLRNPKRRPTHPGAILRDDVLSSVPQASRSSIRGTIDEAPRSLTLHHHARLLSKTPRTACH